MKIKDGKKMTVLAILGVSILLGVLGQLAMKRGMNTIGQTGVTELATKKLFTILTNPYVFLGIALYGVSALLWLVVLSRADLSFAYPMISVAYIIIAVLSWYFFKEPLTPIKISGIALVTIGVFMVLSRL